MAFSWSEDLALGANRVDNQHKEVFRILNTLLNAMDHGKGKEEVGSVLVFLANYIKYFIDEEKLMAAHNYNDYLPQTVEHIQFIKDFFCLKRKFETSGATLHLVVETQQRLGSWVTNHIKTQDKKLGAFLKTKWTCTKGCLRQRRFEILNIKIGSRKPHPAPGATET